MSMSNEFNPKTLKPSRSVPVRFKGRVIAETQWDTREGCWMRYTVWETKGGAYIAQIDGDVPGKPDQVHCTVTVVEPIIDEAGERDETAMQIAVLNGFEWHDRAKALLKRKLGWTPVREVD